VAGHPKTWQFTEQARCSCAKRTTLSKAFNSRAQYTSAKTLFLRTRLTRRPTTHTNSHLITIRVPRCAAKTVTRTEEEIQTTLSWVAHLSHKSISTQASRSNMRISSTANQGISPRREPTQGLRSREGPPFRNFQTQTGVCWSRNRWTLSSCRWLSAKPRTMNHDSKMATVVTAG